MTRQNRAAAKAAAPKNPGERTGAADTAADAAAAHAVSDKKHSTDDDVAAAGGVDPDDLGPMATMAAPGDCGVSVGVGGREYEIVDGKVEVPCAYIDHLAQHGFTQVAPDAEDAE